ncbi:hypothetical protein OPT61_g3219 [Boeremia exigua]|uniref:Uncharacterized protein n=1 Tax=Boeremia exigua TaxID=749465 RepID=A0ACC2IIM4_9PLEO|nr:hypothetical protein OPT61_g3219 [Boeremia exigua]
MTSHGLPLGRLYGPAWLDGELWSPGYKCVWTAEKDQSGHHCPDPECNSEIKTRCYDKLHVAFCLCLVTMANGHQRFCGHRFQAESPKACALHGWGDNEENRVFQRAKKGLSFELPKLIPHEQPGWEMVINGFGGVQQSIYIRMGIINGELCFVRVVSWLSDGQPDQVSEIARVKTKELLLTECDPRTALEAHDPSNEDCGARSAIQALSKTEQNDDEYNNPYSYQKYIDLNLQIAAAEKWREKNRNQTKVEEAIAERLALSRGGKKCGHDSLKSYKRLIKGKKK